MSDEMRIPVYEVRRRMNAGEQFVFIDTRNSQAWAESDVTLPGALRIPLADAQEHLQEIPRDKPIVTYCT
ncbi:MAG TPA: rhodanese-like domain-containing protein [Terriglobales bacterium]|nr:rhodanese-like domain-containing protein [Terriglobales bacterium]